MQTRQLGNSDLHITPIGVGAWAMGGGGWDGSMGPQSDLDSIPAIQAALDYGFNWIDTAALTRKRSSPWLSEARYRVRLCSPSASACGIKTEKSVHR
jgi:aryl-alcohol dehydrogenase-like predicted oxidoreductase